MSPSARILVLAAFGSAAATDATDVVEQGDRGIAPAQASDANTTAPSAPPPCTDDPTYFQSGEAFGDAMNWTSCEEWVGYDCTAGNWGISDPADIAYVMTACPLSCGACESTVNYGSYSYAGDSFSNSYSGLSTSGACACPIEWIDDGECDRQCNTAACVWDANDCFHSDSGCYQHPTGADYRGNISYTIEGRPCQYWESQWPNAHDYSVTNYPDSNLGGHNHCRNPSPEDGEPERVRLARSVLLSHTADAASAAAHTRALGTRGCQARRAPGAS